MPTTGPHYNFNKRFSAIQKILEKNGEWESTLDKIKASKSNQERVNVVYKLPAVQDEIHVDASYMEKSSQKAITLRNSGNAMFKMKKYDDALKLYTQSVLLAPNSNGDKILALAYANRSAALFHLQYYELCLHDINSALFNDYPEDLKYKLFDRQAKCYKNLKLKQEALECLQNAKKSVMNTDMKEDKVKQLVKDIDKEFKTCMTLYDTETFTLKSQKLYNRYHADIPEISDKKNKVYPCASVALTVSQEESMSRGIYAARDIRVGEVLVIENPHSSVLYMPYNFSHCQHCCNRIIAPVPCHQCAGVCYCSEDCRQESWDTYHYAECKYMDIFQSSGLFLGHLSLRMVLRAGAEYLAKYRATADVVGDDYGSGLNKFGIYDSNDYHALYNLCNHCEQRSAEDLFRRAVGAVFFLQCLQNLSFFQSGEISTEKITYVGGHILRHMQMLPCNAHVISELALQKSRVSASESPEVGSAAYAFLSLFNHSCDPDVVRHSFGNVCVLRAIKAVKKGDQVFDNYGALYPVMEKNERIKCLEGQYFFTCQCHACEEDWPQYFDLPSGNPTLICEECRKVVDQVSPNMYHDTCTHCHHTLDVPKIQRMFQASDGVVRAVIEEFLQGSRGPEQTTASVEKHLQFLNTHFRLPWQDFNNCQEVVKQCYSMLANCYFTST